MDVLEMAMPFEKHICEKADGMRIPIAATAELIPVCNMNCRMCYVRMSTEQMKKEGRLLSVEEWLSLIKEAQKQGLLFLLLTGGEPLLYPGFRELYIELKKMGLVISINTNGTLIDEEFADFLAQDKPRRVNISVYGASDKRYEELCYNPQGFTQMMRGVELLQERGIDVKWNYSVTQLNVGDMEEIYRLAKEHNIYIETAYYMFPPGRKEQRERNIEGYWLTSEEAAKVRILAEIHDLGEERFREKCKVVNAVKNGKILIKKPKMESSYTCRAGSSTFWFNWKGELLTCGMVGEGALTVGEGEFLQRWEELKKNRNSYKHPKKCTECPFETLCVRCAAASCTESQSFEEAPEYVCELMEHYTKYVGILETQKILPKNIREF